LFWKAETTSVLFVLAVRSAAGKMPRLYYHHNQQFSTVALTNSSGLVASRYAYTAYGEKALLDFTGAAQDFSTYANH
jgi:hypothetical protein